MRLAPCSVTRIGASIAILGAVALGCASESTTGLAVPDAMYAKGGGSGPTIKSTNPSRGEPGTTLDVRIFGSGFEAGSQASFALDGVVGGNIVTNSTTVISSGELAANISISSGAELTTYDVIVVTPGGKKGIGTEMFLVTYEAVDLGGHPELGMTEAEDVAWMRKDPDLKSLHGRTDFEEAVTTAEQKAQADNQRRARFGPQ